MRIGVLTTIATAIAISAIAVTGGGGGAANVFISTTGNDSTCVRGDASRPCATPQKACSIASAGDTVQVNAGTYSIGFNLNGCNPASTVTFTNVAGTNVFFAGDSSVTNTSHVTISGDRIANGGGFSFGIIDFAGPVSNMTLNNVNLYCQPASPWDVVVGGGGTWCAAKFSLFGAVSNFTWDGGDLGGTASCESAPCSGGNSGDNMDKIIPDQVSGGTAPSNITLRHLTFHNYIALDGAKHDEFIWFGGGSNLLLEYNQFKNCGVAPSGYAGTVFDGCNSGGLFFGGVYTPTVRSITFRGNVDPRGVQWGYNDPVASEFTASYYYNTGITPPCGVSAVKCKAGPSGGADATLNGTNFTFVGNEFNGWFDGLCFASASYSHNLWDTDDGTTAAKCGATDIRASNIAATALWVDPTNSDYTPKAGSLLVDAGEASFCPAADVLGTTRPRGSACDIGAVER